MNGKIAPISKQFGDAINTLEQQLAKHSYHRFPGTSETFLPYKEHSGKYRTGLDVNAPYLERLPEEEKKAEKERIIKDKERLEKALGVPGILEPTSPFYNFAVSREFLIKKFGTDLKVSPVKIGNDDEFFDNSDTMREITWNWIKVHPRVAPSLDAYRKGQVPSDIKYYVVDEGAEVRETFSRKKEINKAIVAFESLTPTKKKQIARLMGLPVTEATTEETVYNLIDSQLKETEFKDGKFKGLAPVRLFNDLIATTDERIKIKDLVEQALIHSIYREAQGGKIVEGGVTVAVSKEDLVTFLLDEKNQMDVIALEKKLNIKKIEKS